MNTAPRPTLSQQLVLRDTSQVVWRALKATTLRDVPDVIALAALDFAKSLGVPPLGGHIWAIESHGAWQLTPGLKFYRLMAARSGKWAGLEWSEADVLVPVTGQLSLPEWVECAALRFTDSGTAKFPARVYARECVRTKSDGGLLPAWRDHPRQMLRVRAECLALATGFPEWLPREELRVRAINPETGEILERPPRHLSSEDIAAGITELEPDDVDDIPF